MSVVEKKQWRELCQSEPDIHIFMRDWWLDAVCGENNWDCIIENSENSYGGGYCAFPFYKMKSHGFNVITQPLLTQKIGPYVHLPEGLDERDAADMSNRLIGAVLDRIPTDIDSVNFNIDWHITDGEPFLERGYEITTRYTDVIFDLTDLENVYKNFDSKLRTHLRKAEKLVSVIECPNIRTFYEIDSKTFARQGLPMPYSFEFVKHLDDVLGEHNARKMWMAVDEQQRIHAVEYLVWDERSAYLLMGGADPALRNSYATNLLVWEAIQYAAQVAEIFDFEGSIMPNVNSFNRTYGPVELPYLAVTKRPSRFYNLLWHGKRVIANLV